MEVPMITRISVCFKMSIAFSIMGTASQTKPHVVLIDDGVRKNLQDLNPLSNHKQDDR